MRTRCEKVKETMSTDKLEALREALEQQRNYEAENTGGASIPSRLASYSCMPPELSSPERLREVWTLFSLAGDIIKRYEDATVALLQDTSITDRATSYKAMETALQLLIGETINLRAELLVIKGVIEEQSEQE